MGVGDTVIPGCATRHAVWPKLPMRPKPPRRVAKLPASTRAMGGGIAMGAPTHKGEVGDTYSDGSVRWVCKGGTQWVAEISPESDAAFRQKLRDDTETR